MALDTSKLKQIRTPGGFWVWRPKDWHLPRRGDLKVGSRITLFGCTDGTYPVQEVHDGYVLVNLPDAPSAMIRFGDIATWTDPTRG